MVKTTLKRNATMGDNYGLMYFHALFCTKNVRKIQRSRETTVVVENRHIFMECQFPMEKCVYLIKIWVKRGRSELFSRQDARGG